MIKLVSTTNDEFECRNGTYFLKKKFTAPDHLQESPLMKVYSAYFRSSVFLKLADITRYSYYTPIQTFADWLGENYESDDQIPENIIFPTYFNHLIDSNVPKTSVKSIIYEICKPLTLAKHQRIPECILNPKLKSILKNKPKFPKTKEKSAPVRALSQLGSNNINRNDTDLIESLRLVTQWFLSESQRQRKLLLSNSDVVEKLNILKHSNKRIMKPPFSHMNNGNLGGNSKIDKDSFEKMMEESRELYSSIIKAAIEFNDDCLIERIAYSQPDILRKAKENLHSPSPFNKSDLVNILKNWLSPAGLLYKNTPSINTISFAELVAPSDAEALSMAMLLASDRIQKGGLFQLELDDFSFEKNPVNPEVESVQISFNKGRRRGNVGDITSTPIYQSTSIIYNTFKNWHRLMSDAQIFFDDDRKGKAFHPLTTEIFNGGRRILHGRTTAFGLLGVTNSLLQRKCLSDIKESCFIDLLTEVMAHNFKVAKQEALFEQQHKLFRDGKRESVKRSDYVTIKRTWLSITSIAKSRVEMDDSVGYVESTLAAHSEQVKADVYKNRSETNESIQRNLKFAEKVGNAMEQDAMKVKALLKKTKFVELKNIRKELNLTSPSEDISEILSDLPREFDSGLFGEIIANGTTYIISDPLVGALIISYIKYIDENIDGLANAFPARVNAVRIHRQFLNEVLRSFPDPVISDAIDIAEDHEFPFPPLY